MRALVLAPLLERPAAERKCGQSRDKLLPNRHRAGSKDRAFRAVVATGDLLADPRARELAQHHCYSLTLS